MIQPVTTSKRLIQNTLFNVLLLVSNALIGFFLIRFFLGRLGEAQYGVWVLVGSLFRYRGMLSLGLNGAINRQIPICLAKGDEQGIAKVVSTSLFFYSALGLVLAALSVLLYAKIGDWFAIEPEQIEAAGRLVLIVGLTFAISSPLQLTTAVLSGLQRYGVISIATLVVLVVRTVLLIVLLLRGYGLLTMGLVFGMSEIVTRLVQHIFIRRLLPRVSLSRQNIDPVLLKEMLLYGTNTFLYSMGGLIVCKAGDLIAGIFLDTSAVSRFSVASAGVLLLSQLLQAFTAAIKPAVSDLDTREEHATVKEIAFLTQKYSLLVLVPAGAFLIVMGREFLRIWVGQKFSDPTVIDSLATVLALLTVGHCLMLAQHSNFLVLIGRGEHGVFGTLAAVTAILCVGGSIVAVRALGWGLEGIAWSNLVPMAVVSGLFVPIYFNRRMKISTRESLACVWWPALRGSLPAVAMMVAWKALSPPASWFGLLGVILASGMLTCLCGWLFSVQPAERRRLLAVLQRGPTEPLPGNDV
ncbi:MAG: oligosaccharide flippase family protein [Planctomycetota bacterium]|nr:oligosaccharide flippase family protein [Planctomycetota bacterium]